MIGPVLLVGGGPGDPDLLTLRAEAALATAACVVADAEVVDLAAAFAQRAHVVVAPAASPGDDADTSLLVQAALGGAGPVVRLYRGDPWLHPAHAAEAAALATAGVPTESVAGISVAIGTATAAGRPTHHRAVAVVAAIIGDRVEPIGERHDMVVTVDPPGTMPLHGVGIVGASAHSETTGVTGVTGVTGFDGVGTERTVDLDGADIDVDLGDVDLGDVDLGDVDLGDVDLDGADIDGGRRGDVDLDDVDEETVEEETVDLDEVLADKDGSDATAVDGDVAHDVGARGDG